MNFHDFECKLMEHFRQISFAYGTAFQTDVDKDELWNIYLNTFPERKNRIYRTRREMDCSCCRHFIKEIGGIVLIDGEMRIHTLWEFRVDDPDYQIVLDALDAYVRSRSIVDVYVSKEHSVGTYRNHESDANGNVKIWEHLYLKLPASYQYKGRDTIDTVRSRRRATVQVFERSLNEISLEAIDCVLELIQTNSLYKGEQWKVVLTEFRGHKIAYEKLSAEKRKLYAWTKSELTGAAIGRIRNHSIGVLLTDVSIGMNLNEAVSRYEHIVAPTNYRRPKAIYTAKMLEDAKKTVTELGYIDSLQRRFARLEDISVNNILFANRDASKRIEGDVFDEMLNSAAISPKKFSRVEEVPIERFIREVLPGAREVEAFVENRHERNMVSLTAPVNPSAPSMFKWNNAFGWAYSGNMTDSDISRNVKAAGGNIDGVLRFSIQWNDVDRDRNDLDAHCREPNGHEIYFRAKHSYYTGGELDVDIINPIEGTPAVENIVWTDRSRMLSGKYSFCVHQFTNRGGRNGFRAEISFDGTVYRYDYRNELREDEFVDVADVTLHDDGTFTIEEKLPSSMSMREIWGVKTMRFTPVSVIMYSPNYWDEQQGIGNKHYMFMLRGCVNPERPNGFYNEFLKQELAAHKRVFEALGSKMAVAETRDQLSGLGFSSTLRNELIVKVKGATERIIKIKI